MRVSDETSAHHGKYGTVVGVVDSTAVNSAADGMNGSAANKIADGIADGEADGAIRCAMASTVDSAADW